MWWRVSPYFFLYQLFLHVLCLFFFIYTALLAFLRKHNLRDFGLCWIWTFSLHNVSISMKKSGQCVCRLVQLNCPDTLLPPLKETPKDQQEGKVVADLEISVGGTATREIRKTNHPVTFLKRERHLGGNTDLIPSLQKSRIFQFGVAPG